jgi:protein-tyrosine phosphatase
MPPTAAKVRAIYGDSVRLLFVCTGSLCRSPIAERLVKARVPDALGARASSVWMTSAGLAAIPGGPMHPYSAEALVAHLGDPEGFMSKRFQPEMAVQADLVLTMTKTQRREVLLRAPRGLRHTFTLWESAGLLEHADLDGLTSVPLGEWARALAARLDTVRRYAFPSSDDDIANPISGNRKPHREAAAAVAEALQPLLAALLPSNVTTYNGNTVVETRGISR